MIESFTKQEESRVFKQRLQRIHQVTGVSLALIIYVMLFFGVLAIVLPYINPWAKPSNHIAIVDSTKIEYEKIINPILEDKEIYSKDDISLVLPEGGYGSFMGERILRVRIPFIDDMVYDPNSYKKLDNANLGAGFSYFLNEMHYGSPLGQESIYIFGFVAMGGVFLIVGGLILLLKIKYKNSVNTPTGIFSKYHRKILLWLSFPLLIIFISGTILNFNIVFFNPVTYIATKGESTEFNKYTVKLWYPTFFNKTQKKEEKTIKASMLPINELLKKVQELRPNIDFKGIHLSNWGYENAKVTFGGLDYSKPFIGNEVNNPFVVLSGVDGSLIKEHKVTDASFIRMFRDSLFFLHFLQGVNDYLRVFMALIMSLCTIAVGFGVLLYLEKKARKFPIGVPVYQGLGKVSLAVMIGVIPATGLIFALQWGLPFEIEDRLEFQKMCFAVCWVATLTWSFYRINSYQASKELLYLGGFLFVLTPILHSINSGFSPIELFLTMGKIFAVDLVLFLFGLALIYIAYKLPTKREKIQEFWISRGVK
ncbi:PepSY domain-containing protein [Aliarcobacter lanthieri]|uniref:PepSY domain-containing protein n=1 Tax=Aliarcobacter lanthieri TaxID=1355374 RepID=UPI003AACDA54